MLVLLVVSAAWALTAQPPKHTKAQEDSSTAQRLESDHFVILRNLAVSQLLLTLLTLTTAHVQIITRLSSAFPVWVWFLAMPSKGGASSLAKNAVRTMVMYGIIQGALFSLFLPPA
jgi:phosphatidylinositol glycan class V